MALLDYTIDYAGASQPLAAPTTSEAISAPGPGVLLEVTIGATATTVTIVQPGTDGIGEPKPDKVLSALTNTTRKIKVDGNYRDANNQAAVTFSQVTAVTAAVFRIT